MIATQASCMLVFFLQNCAIPHEPSYACCWLHKAVSQSAALWTLSMFLTGLEDSMVACFPPSPLMPT